MKDSSSIDKGAILKPNRLGRELFSTEIPVMVEHLNYGNHLGYDSVLTILQEARMRWLKVHGMSELSLEGSVGYIVTHASVDYEGEAFYGDQLKVRIFGESINRKGFRLVYQVTNEPSGKSIASVDTKHFFFDFSRRSIAVGPERFSSLFASADVKVDSES